MQERRKLGRQRPIIPNVQQPIKATLATPAGDSICQTNGNADCRWSYPLMSKQRPSSGAVPSVRVPRRQLTEAHLPQRRSQLPGRCNTLELDKSHPLRHPRVLLSTGGLRPASNLDLRGVQKYVSRAWPPKSHDGAGQAHSRHKPALALARAEQARAATRDIRR